MKDGDRVVVGGAVDVYERDGRYQMYAREITLEGAGALYERFLALKAELEEMGMFAPEYKQPIRRFIQAWRCDCTFGCGSRISKYFSAQEPISSDHSVSGTGTGRQGSRQHCAGYPYA